MKMVCYLVNDQYVNLDATRLVDQPGAIEVYNGNELVSMIAKDFIEAIYITQKKEKEDRRK